MNWTQHIRSEFARLGKQPDHTVIEELAQHAAEAYEAARADGESASDAGARVRACAIPARRAARIDPIDALRR